MSADSTQYALAAATPVTIRGGRYALVSKAATGNLQIATPDGTFVNVASADVLATPIALAAAGCIAPLYLPAGQVQIATGSGWLVGVG